MFFGSFVKRAMCHLNGIGKEAPSVADGIFEGLRVGNRSALAKAITLVESTNPGHKKQAQQLLTKVLQLSRYKQMTNSRYGVKGASATGSNNPSSLRIAISGPPGAGKSSFIEKFGCHVCNLGLKIAVLAIDPSSAITGGSLLGDKTRMPNLSINSNAYIRPSPTSGNLGGVARSTSEAVSICEFFGFDIILIETVGVGQSEYAVVDMVDMFILLNSPAAGDDLQGIKRGIMEMANLIIFTKYDGNLKPVVDSAVESHKLALRLMKSPIVEWPTAVHRVSSETGEGIDETLKLIQEFWDKLGKQTDILDRRRMTQLKKQMWYHLQNNLISQFVSNSKMSQLVKDLEEQVMIRSISPGSAADQLISTFNKQNKLDY